MNYNVSFNFRFDMAAVYGAAVVDCSSSVSISKIVGPSKSAVT